MQWHFPTASEAKDPLKAAEHAKAAKEREDCKQKHPPSLSSSSSQPPNAKRPRVAPAAAASSASSSKANDDFLELADATSMAIIVPYRD